MSPLLLEELSLTFAAKKVPSVRRPRSADRYVELLRRDAAFTDDPSGPLPIRYRDLDDDYLIALAHEHATALVSGDDDLLELAGQIPVFTPAQFLAVVD